MISKIKYTSLAILAGAVLLGFFVYSSEVNKEGFFSNFPFHFGLDIQGGAHLVYRADVSGIEGERETRERMNALRGLIEDRVNALGVSEPLVQVERGGLLGEGEYRLIVELPGVTDLEKAMEAIGETPVLEFRLAKEDAEPFIPDSPSIDIDFDEETDEIDLDLEEEPVDEENIVSEDEEEEVEEGEETEETKEDPNDIFVFTGLDGSMLNNAQFGRNPSTGEPLVRLQFNKEGKDLFADITRDNVGRQLAIFLDGEPITTPFIRDVITGGEATVSGNFTVVEARDLARRLKSGALPLPIEILSTENIGASLGQKILDDGVRAGFWGLLLVAIFIILWYRLPGAVAVGALTVYLVVMLSVFKLIPVTLTAAGIAGFILSIGMAVDANIIIFERIKEELRGKKGDLRSAVENGFSRAWLSIRDANISSLITAVILYWFGTPLVQGFALVFFIGVLISMATAISVTRTFLLSLADFSKEGALFETLFDSGLNRESSE